jgi:hypothetical protein
MSHCFSTLFANFRFSCIGSLQGSHSCGSNWPREGVVAAPDSKGKGPDVQIGDTRGTRGVPTSGAGTGAAVLRRLPMEMFSTAGTASGTGYNSFTRSIGTTYPLRMTTTTYPKAKAEEIQSFDDGKMRVNPIRGNGREAQLNSYQPVWVILRGSTSCLQ